MIPTSPELSVRHLYFSYPPFPGVPARALADGLDLELPGGCTGLLLARPDQGKTTLCRALAGLVPRFSGGKIGGQLRLGAFSLLDHPPFELIEQVGLVFQHPGEQLLASRCDSEVAFGLESLGTSRREIEIRLDRGLKAMGLERYRNRPPKTLSGGEKKKLLIACLVALNPRLWLLDETLEELDVGTRRSLLELVSHRRGSTLLLSAKWHDMFGGYVDRIFLMENGRVHRIDEAPGSRSFHQLLVRQGFELPDPARGRAGLRTARSSDTAEQSTLLEARDLEFRYPGTGAGPSVEFTLRIERLRLAAGRTMALVGDNGSGKSTLGRLLCGLLVPQQGVIRIRKDGRLQPAAESDLNRFTGYLFQDPDLQIFLPTIFQELALGLKRLELTEQETRNRVEQAVRLFELPGPQTPPSLMSYGNRKKLQAAVYYLLDRPLVIIDEGDSGLSVGDFAHMIRIFQKPETALVFITHDHRLAGALADEVVELRLGRPA